MVDAGLYDTAAFSLMQRVKRRFFAMRNGDLGRQMEVRGLHYKINFGLNLPQITEIAKEITEEIGREYPNAEEATLTELADQLWANATTRESLLIAPMLHPKATMSMAKAQRWIAEVPTIEVADILCHKLLRSLPFAKTLTDTELSDSELATYTRLRLAYNLYTLGHYSLSELQALAVDLSADAPLCSNLAAQIANE